MCLSVGLGHDRGTLETEVQGAERDNRSAVTRGRALVCLCYYTGLLVYILEDGPVVAEGWLFCVLEHLAHVLWSASAVDLFGPSNHLPQPYAICAIWLLGTRAPLEFLTTLGEASGAALEVAETGSIATVRCVDNRA